MHEALELEAKKSGESIALLMRRILSKHLNLEATVAARLSPHVGKESRVDLIEQKTLSNQAAVRRMAAKLDKHEKAINMITDQLDRTGMSPK